ncbi:MAG: pantoate--beta-alanine ligase [Bacteroidetes bacterium]|nr:pantoate--beta-alanine ligase [Rhodothermia bacterium]MCS7155472.1 pantoate--beta-alanine ligase [Bacteroidota bacterium]MCX7907435.1 pantoate--beta-alanine ligase [Bacteroidota bacterium]MDW8138429.1 pantoate--beta-alanine ligase [Bacteroidota bacterium]MDW8284634.1 pantoate--beta-alanine ligase [Bacteroidota bacterium]
MEIIQDIRQMQRRATELRAQSRRIAVVPTMGALHDGHLALVRMARQHADVVIVTLFVNPIQFGPHEDYARYPRDWQGDLHKADAAGVDILFAPSVEAMYPNGYQTYVVVTELSRPLEGAMRPGHFRGVTTVVSKLFHLTCPHVAVFGQKDAQQALIIRRMVRDLNFDVDILIHPIVREPDGLAMSSRNVYLSPQERAQAPVLYRALQWAEGQILSGERNPDRLIEGIRRILAEAHLARIDYVAVCDTERLDDVAELHPGQEVLVALAVRFGSTRLLDNILITVPER